MFIYAVTQIVEESLEGFLDGYILLRFAIKLVISIYVNF